MRFRLGAFEACVQFLTGAQLADMEEKKEGESKLEGGCSEIFCISLCETGDLQRFGWNIFCLILYETYNPQA